MTLRVLAHTNVLVAIGCDDVLVVLGQSLFPYKSRHSDDEDAYSTLHRSCGTSLLRQDALNSYKIRGHGHMSKDGLFALILVALYILGGLCCLDWSNNVGDIANHAMHTEEKQSSVFNTHSREQNAHTDQKS